MYKPKPPCILYLSSFPPRECGIATFTQDLTNAIDREFNPELKSKILAINDNGTSIYNYPRKVVRTLSETAIEDYLNRANEINRMADVKLVNIQHEYGLFGGDQGEFLIPFLELLNKPVIVTLHTVLPAPGEKMKRICQQIAARSLGIVVMTTSAKQILIETYEIKA
jgi:polysaccharide biosynthesis protein PslF